MGHYDISNQELVGHMPPGPTYGQAPAIVLPRSYAAPVLRFMYLYHWNITKERKLNYTLSAAAPAIRYLERQKTKANSDVFLKIYFSKKIAEDCFTQIIGQNQDDVWLLSFLCASTGFRSKSYEFCHHA